MGELQRVYVHIGPPKSGTTFIQNVLFANKPVLEGAGVVLPRPDWSAHRRAAVHLTRRAADVVARPPDDAAPRDLWDRLVREVHRAGAHTAIVSAEQLSNAESPSVRALVESFSPAQVHVVYTARDLAAVVPAAWQTRLRNRQAPTWQGYCASLRAPDGADSFGASFWREQDPAAVLPRWLAVVPPERVHVVTVPPSGSEPALLWRRFGAVTGLDADRYSLDVPRTNSSLGGVEAEVLRRLTAHVADQLSVAVYTDLVKHFVVRELLEPREQSFRLVLPEAEHAWLDPRADKAVDYLRDNGFDVVGDLDDLTPVHVRSTREPDDVDEVEVAALLDEVLALTVLEMARRQGGSRWRGTRSTDTPDQED